MRFNFSISSSSSCYGRCFLVITEQPGSRMATNIALNLILTVSTKKTTPKCSLLSSHRRRATASLLNAAISRNRVPELDAVSVPRSRR